MLKYTGLCNRGLVREQNQDAILMYENDRLSLFAVADGMGGHSNGEIASGIVIQRLKDWARDFDESNFENNFMKIVESLSDTIAEANRHIYNEYTRSKICGTTLVALLCYEGAYAAVSAGDSRIYMLDGFRVKMITADEVWENQHEVKKSYCAAEIKKHRDYGKLVNAIGINELLSLNIVTNVLKTGQVFLLCSDGLYKMCRPDRIRQALRRIRWKDQQEVKQQLLENVFKAGAKDNVSFIFVSLT